MSALLERILDLVIGWVKFLLPFYVLGDDQIGLVRRLGVYRRNLKPGWNWKAPVIDEPKETSAALESLLTKAQTLTTADGRAVSLSGVIGYRVVNARKYILECGDVEGVINDIGSGVIGDVIPGLPFAAVMATGKGSAARKCRTRMRTQAKQWGIEISSFRFVDRVAARAVHVLGVERKAGV